jgi:hypothetical protein
MPDTTVDDLCREFQGFIKHRRIGRPDSEYIADYIDEWLTTEEDGAVVAVNGDYTLYLQVVIAIINNCLRDSHFLDYEGSDPGWRPRPVRGLINPENTQPMFVNPHYFRGIVFDLQTQGR